MLAFAILIARADAGINCLTVSGALARTGAAVAGLFVDEGALAVSGCCVCSQAVSGVHCVPVEPEFWYCVWLSC